MSVVSISSRKKSWQPGRERVRFMAALAIQRENVMQRLVRLREEVGHPDKAGEPLPQDQAAARAGVTARQWQRWESGESVPYARNLSAVADAFEFHVSEFYDGPAGSRSASTPDPFQASEPGQVEMRIEAMERELREQGDRYAQLIEEQNGLLSRQSLMLERIERSQAEIEKFLSMQAAAARQMEEATRMLQALEPVPREQSQAQTERHRSAQ